MNANKLLHLWVRRRRRADGWPIAGLAFTALEPYAVKDAFTFLWGRELPGCSIILKNIFIEELIMEKIICNKEVKNNNLYIKADSLREPILELIKKDYPHFNSDCYIEKNEVTKFRNIHLASLIKKENNEFNLLDKDVIEAISNKDIISNNIEDNWNDKLSIGQKVADKVAKFGGSWAFIISFTLFLFLWVATNVWFLASKPFDPYPFILLNLFLSALAAIQAPVIMMSQNRQEDKDRKRGENDYKVNLKAELEIKLLHEKIDHLILYQNQKILEILDIQTDYLEDINEKLKTVNLK